MKITRKILTALLCLAMLASMVVSVSAEETLSATDVYASDRWVAQNRWDFDGNLTDSVGGAVAKKLEGTTFWQDPTYANGKIVLNGTSVYTFEEALTFPNTDDLKWVRIDIKAKLNTSMPAAGHRIFGSNAALDAESKSKSGFYFANIAWPQYGGGGFYLQGTADGVAVWKAAETDIDLAAEHTYTAIMYNGMVYYYCDGALVLEQANPGNADIRFTDFLGCSFVTNSPNNNFYGEIDYIQISQLGNKSPEPSTNTTAPAPVVGSSESTPGGTTDTGDVMIALPVAVIAVASVAVVASRKKKND